MPEPRKIRIKVNGVTRGGGPSHAAYWWISYEKI